MKILVAAPTGLCFGVKRAIGFVEKALAQTAPVYALGSPIHNPQEVERLQKMGLRVVQSETGDLADMTALIRAHGRGPRRAGKSEEKKRQRHRRHVCLRARGTGACAGIVRGRLSRSDPRERETSRDGRYPRLCPRTFDGDFDDSVTFFLDNIQIVC